MISHADSQMFFFPDLLSARNSDPSTSHAATTVARIMAKKDAPKVMEALRAHPSGLTGKEISKLPTGRPRADTRWEATQGGGAKHCLAYEYVSLKNENGVPPA